MGLVLVSLGFTLELLDVIGDLLELHFVAPVFFLAFVFGQAIVFEDAGSVRLIEFLGIKSLLFNGLGQFTPHEEPLLLDSGHV